MTRTPQRDLTFDVLLSKIAFATPAFAQFNIDHDQNFDSKVCLNAADRFHRPGPVKDKDIHYGPNGPSRTTDEESFTSAAVSSTKPGKMYPGASIENLFCSWETHAACAHHTSEELVNDHQTIIIDQYEKTTTCTNNQMR